MVGGVFKEEVEERNIASLNLTISLLNLHLDIPFHGKSVAPIPIGQSQIEVIHILSHFVPIFSYAVWEVIADDGYDVEDVLQLRAIEMKSCL